MAAAVENFEKLSNNEIRLKCIEFGLPNVPVTDSSRKLLIKRLNDTINNAAPKDNSKSSNRRETINIAKTAPPEVDMPKNRRTISAATLVTAKDDNAPTAIPVSTRRRSVQKEPTESMKPTKTTTTKPLQSILIEDDEDEDIVLMNAADNAEKESTTSSSVPIENITGRRKSRSVSVPKVTEIINTVSAAAAKKRAMTPLTEDKLETIQHETITQTAVEPQISTRAEIVNIVSVQKLPSLDSPIILTQQPTVKSNFEVLSHHNLQNTTPSVYSTPSSMRYTVGSVASTTIGTGGLGYRSSSLSAYRTKYTAENILNELSDTEATQDDGCKSPFLSSFARDLERRRSVGRSITTTGSNYDHYVRRSGASSYEKNAIRGRRGSKADVSMGQILVALNRKYHLKTIFYLLVLVCISIFIYVYLYA